MCQCCRGFFSHKCERGDHSRVTTVFGLNETITVSKIFTFLAPNISKHRHLRSFDNECMFPTCSSSGILRHPSRCWKE